MTSYASTLRTVARTSAIALCALAGVELLLYGAYSVTKAQSLSLQEKAEPATPASNNDYPENPDNYLKIAVFGGSTAHGYNAERSFSQLLPLAMAGSHTANKPLYVHNYAREGMPIHGYGATLAKDAASLYDVIILYAGTNETSVGYVPQGYYKIDEQGPVLDFKSPVLSEIDRPRKATIGEALYSWSLTKSRTLNLLRIATHWLQLPQFFVRKNKILEFQDHHILPIEERKRIGQRLHDDIQSIARLLEHHGGRLIVISEPSDLLFPPQCSVWPRGMDITKKTTLGQFLSSVNQPSENELADILKEAPDLAQANFLQGVATLRRKDAVGARSWLIRAKDNDCIAERSTTILSEKMREASASAKSTFFIDGQSVFDQINAPLFSDPVHPNVLGHAIVAVLIARLLHDPMVNESLDAQRLLRDAQAVVNAAQLTQNEIQATAFSAARWNYLKSLHSARPDYYVDAAHRHIKACVNNSEIPHDAQVVTCLLLKAALFLELDDRDGAFLALKDALTINSKVAINRIGEGFPFSPPTLRDRLLLSGFHYMGSMTELIKKSHPL